MTATAPAKRVRSRLRGTRDLRAMLGGLGARFGNAASIAAPQASASPGAAPQASASPGAAPQDGPLTPLLRGIGWSSLLVFALAALGAAGVPHTDRVLGGLLRALAWDDAADLDPHTLRADIALAEPVGPNEMARSWSAPLERIARGQNAVREVAAETGVGRAVVRIALDPRADAEAAAEALDLAATPLRVTLPSGALLRVTAEQRPAPILRRYFLDRAWGHAELAAFAHRLRLAPGVRAVEIAEVRRDEVRIALAAGSEPLADELRAAVRSFLAPTTALGVGTAVRLERAGSGAPPSGISADVGGLDVDPALLARRLAALAIPTPAGAVRLDALAEVVAAPGAATAETRIDGRDGSLVTVRRERNLAPWIVAAGLPPEPVAAPAGSAPTLLDDEAQRWGGLLTRHALLLALLLAALSALVAREERRPWSAACARIAPWLGLALLGGALGFLGFGIALAPATLATAGLGFAGALPLCLAPRRAESRQTALFLLAMLASIVGLVWMLGGRFDDRLRLPALAAPVAAAAALLAARALPLRSARPPRLPRAAIARRVRAIVRDPASVWLVLLGISVGVFLLLADVVHPVASNGALSPSDLGIRLELPLATSPREARDRALAVEGAVHRVDGVERIETTITPERIVARLRLASAWRDPAARSRLAEALRRKLPFGEVETHAAGESDAVSVLFDALPGVPAASRPRSPWSAETYPMRLVAADGEALQRSFDALRERFVAMHMKSSRLHPGWGAQTQRVVLAPLPTATGTPQGEMLAAVLRQGSTAEPAFTGVGSTGVRLAWPGRTDQDQPPPQRTALLDRPVAIRTASADRGASVLVAAERASAADERLTDHLGRRAGRFVLPVDFDVPGSTDGSRRMFRARVDAELAGLALDGALLERPVLDRYALDTLDLRLAGTLAALCGLWLLATAAWSGRLALTGRLWPRLPLLAALPFFGAATLALVLGLDGAPADERQWLAMALGIAPALALAARAIVAGARGASSARLHRAVLSAFPGSAAGLLAAVALAMVTVAPSAELASWAFALRHGAAVLAAVGAIAWIAVPAAAAATGETRDRRRLARTRAVRHWSAEPTLELEARNLVKSYGGFVALDRVSFVLQPGITGLLGPNGAGKTTLLRLLVGLLEPSRGSVRFCGETVTRDVLDAYRRRLGFLPQDFNAYPGFTAEDFLRHWARARALSDSADEIGRLLEAVGLAAHATRRVRDFSGGMRRRLGIGVALLGAPSVLIVDEPTTGLDLPSRQQLREILLRAAGERIVLLSTHIASDVEAVAQRLLVLRAGRLVFDGPAAELQARARGRVHEVVLADGDLLAFARQHQVTRRIRQLDGVRVRAVASPGVSLGGTEVEPNLEEAYLAAQRPS